MECPKCGTEVKEPVKTWENKQRVVMGLFDCKKCNNRFRFAVKKVLAYEQFIEANPTVKEWLERRPENTKKGYGSSLQMFCEYAHIEPDEFQNLPRKKARDIAWDYIRTLLDKPSVASRMMASLKSYYRNKDGESLPFDSRRGGKHHFNNRRRKREKYEHVPNNKEVYEIADMAISLRDRAIILTLFQSGIRVNALCRLKYGHVREQLEEGKIPLRLKITDEIDTKLQGYSMSYYYTFVGREAIESLKRYCDLKHKHSKDSEPLFRTQEGKSMSPILVWNLFKKAVVRAGFKRREMTAHTLRKSFKKVIRNTKMDDDFKEAIMGHVLPNSRENYFSRKDFRDVEAMYEELDFSREGKQYDSLHEKIDVLEAERGTLNNIVQQQAVKIEKLKEKVERTEGVEGYIDHLYKQMKKLQNQINELTGKKRKLEVPDFVQAEQE